MFWLILFIFLSVCYSYEGRKTHGRDFQSWLGEGKHFLAQNNKDSANVVSNIQKPSYFTTMSSSEVLDLDEEDLMGDGDIPTPVIFNSTESNRPNVYFYNKNYIFNIFMPSPEPELMQTDDISDDISQEVSSATSPVLMLDSPIHTNDDSSQISSALKNVFEAIPTNPTWFQQSNGKSGSTTLAPAIDAGLRVDINIAKEPNIVEKHSEPSPDNNDKIIDNIFKMKDEEGTLKKTPKEQDEPLDDYIQSWFEKRLFSPRSNPANTIISSSTSSNMVPNKISIQNTESSESNEDIFYEVRKAVEKVLPSLLAKAAEERSHRPKIKNGENGISIQDQK